MAKRKAKQNLFGGFMGGDGYDEFTRNYLYYKNYAIKKENSNFSFKPCE